MIPKLDIPIPFDNLCCVPFIALTPVPFTVLLACVFIRCLYPRSPHYVCLNLTNTVSEYSERSVHFMEWYDPRKSEGQEIFLGEQGGVRSWLPCGF
jgi:hypothetical protein